MNVLPRWGLRRSCWRLISQEKKGRKVVDQLAAALIARLPAAARRRGRSEVISIVKSTKDDCKTAYSRTIVERVIKEKTPVSMLDTLEEKVINLSESIKVAGIRSIMCVPLISRSKVMGVLYVDSVKKPHGFRKEDLDLLTALSSPAAVAIENSLLHSKYEAGMS